MDPAAGEVGLSGSRSHNDRAGRPLSPPQEFVITFPGPCACRSSFHQGDVYEHFRNANA